jgi:hypothetical protein
VEEGSRGGGDNDKHLYVSFNHSSIMRTPGSEGSCTSHALFAEQGQRFPVPPSSLDEPLENAGVRRHAWDTAANRTQQINSNTRAMKNNHVSQGSILYWCGPHIAHRLSISVSNAMAAVEVNHEREREEGTDANP